MGRTRRYRLKKKCTLVNKSFDKDLTIIELNRWLKKNSWDNENKLKIVSFPETGRGVMTTKQFDPGDIIIELPFNLMISYTTLANSENFNRLIFLLLEKITIHEMLCLFLILEYHLKEKSFWYNYINSLPKVNDILSLSLATDEEKNYLDTDVRNLVEKDSNKLEDNWSRVKPLLNTNYTCLHCNARVNDFLTRDLYIWAHLIVTTRTVYCDPEVVRNASNSNLNNFLSDEPSMALCPFLDMINHSSNTYTNAYLSEFSGKYFLVTNTTFKKYEQIFICYGAHDNKRLLSQYGFVLSNNKNETVNFTLKEILTILKISATSKQYKFLQERKLNDMIHMSYMGPSFNLAAVLYVLTNPSVIDWTICVFSGDYSKEQLRVMARLAKQLLEFKLNQYTNKRDQLVSNINSFSEHLKLYLAYVENQIDCIQGIIQDLDLDM